MTTSNFLNESLKRQKEQNRVMQSTSFSRLVIKKLNELYESIDVMLKLDGSDVKIIWIQNGKKFVVVDSFQIWYEDNLVFERFDVNQARLELSFELSKEFWENLKDKKIIKYVESDKETLVIINNLIKAIETGLLAQIIAECIEIMTKYGTKFDFFGAKTISFMKGNNSKAQLHYKRK